MKTCCKSTKKDKQCVRKSDGKQFKLPRRFTKKRCKQGVKGFNTFLMNHTHILLIFLSAI